MELLYLKNRISYQNDMQIKINSFSDQKLNHKDNECKNEKVNNSLKLSNNQSFSTGVDEVRDTEIKESISQKNLNIFDNSNSFINNTHIMNKKNINLFSKDLALSKHNNNENKFKNKNKILFNIEPNKTYFINSLILFEKILKFQKEENIIEQKTAEKNILNKTSNNKGKIKPKENNKIFKNDCDNIFNKSNAIQLKNDLKPLPPKLPFLFNNVYKLSEEGQNNIYINSTYDKINRSEVPNVFYNHIMITNNISNENSKFYSFSTTNRIKGKLLTIVYFSPNKNI